MTKVLPITDVLGYDAQNSSFSSSTSPSPSHSDSTKKEAIYQHGYVGFCNAMRLVIHVYKQPPLVAMTTVHIGQMATGNSSPQLCHTST